MNHTTKGCVFRLVAGAETLLVDLCQSSALKGWGRRAKYLNWC